MASEFVILGIPEVLDNIDRITEDLWKQLGKALHNECLRVLEVAKSRVPVLSGRLRDSGQVSEPEYNSREVSVTITFGDESVNYAIPVHEKMQIRHLNGRSKFLESVMLEQQSTVLENIAQQISL